MKTAALSTVFLMALSSCAGDLTGAQSGDKRSTRSTAGGSAQVTPNPTSMQTTPDEPQSPDGEGSDPASTTSPGGQKSTGSPSPTKAPAILKAGDKGEQVRELQHRLLQLDWFAGKITADYGQSTQAAVQGFQGKRGLATTGEVDKKTWDVLVGMTRKPTHDEMYNVLKPGPALLKLGDSGAKVRDLQARLKQLDWYEQKVTGSYAESTVAAVKGFQKKREIPVTGEVDQRTLDRLRAMTTTPTPEELTNKPPKQPAPRGLDQRCMSGRVLCISKSSNSLSWVVDGKVQRTVDVRFGSELTPTREGAFTLYWKSRHHVSTLYHTPMPWAMFFSGGQAVHYSSDFAARGYNGASHGCVNVRDKSAIAWIYGQTREGDKVIVYR